MLITKLEKKKQEELKKKELLKKKIKITSVALLSAAALTGVGVVIANELNTPRPTYSSISGKDTLNEILDEMSIKNVAALTIIYAHMKYPKDQIWAQLYKDAMKGKIHIKKYKKYTFDGYHVKAKKGSFIYVINGKALFIFDPTTDRMTSKIIIGDATHLIGSFSLKDAYVDVAHHKDTHQIGKISPHIIFDDTIQIQPSWEVAMRERKFKLRDSHLLAKSSKSDFHLGKSSLLAKSTKKNAKSSKNSNAKLRSVSVKAQKNSDEGIVTSSSRIKIKDLADIDFNPNRGNENSNTQVDDSFSPNIVVDNNGQVLDVSPIENNPFIPNNNQNNSFHNVNSGSSSTSGNSSTSKPQEPTTNFNPETTSVVRSANISNNMSQLLLDARNSMQDAMKDYHYGNADAAHKREFNNYYQQVLNYVSQPNISDADIPQDLKDSILGNTFVSVLNGKATPRKNSDAEKYALKLPKKTAVDNLDSFSLLNLDKTGEDYSKLKDQILKANPNAKDVYLTFDQNSYSQIVNVVYQDGSVNVINDAKNQLFKQANNSVALWKKNDWLNKIPVQPLEFSYRSDLKLTKKEKQAIVDNFKNAYKEYLKPGDKVSIDDDQIKIDFADGSSLSQYIAPYYSIKEAQAASFNPQYPEIPINFAGGMQYVDGTYYSDAMSESDKAQFLAIIRQANPQLSDDDHLDFIENSDGSFGGIAITFADGTTYNMDRVHDLVVANNTKDNETYPPQIPNYVYFDNAFDFSKWSAEDQQQVIDAVQAANPDAVNVYLLPETDPSTGQVNVSVVLTYADGSENTIDTGNFVQAGIKPPDNTDYNEDSENNYAVQTPDYVPVSNPSDFSKWTDAERQQVIAAIKQANPDAVSVELTPYTNMLTGETEASATLTYSDGSQNTLDDFSFIVPAIGPH